MLIHQDVRVYAGKLNQGRTEAANLPKGRHAWVQMIKGGLHLNGTLLQAGDGAALSQTEKLEFSADENAEFLLFDLR